MMKNTKEIQDFLKIKKYLLFMFYWLIVMIVLFLIGFIAVIVTAIIFKNEMNKNNVLYVFISYLGVIFIFLLIYFIIGGKFAKLLNNNPLAVVIYGKKDLLKNPFLFIKEVSKINYAINDLKAGSTIQQIKEKYFSSSTD